MNTQKTGKQKLLQALCHFRCLTTSQCVEAGLGSHQMIRRHLRSLKTSGFIQFEPWLLGRDTGRPENLAVPTKRGLRALNLAGAPIEERCYPHQYLLNWCQIRLRSLNCTDLQLSYEPLPFMPLSVSGHQLVPDLAFTLYSHELDKRLLFFLEMDMGTESLASPTRRTGDLRQKIELYREYFMASHYRSISSPASPLNGFRILFVLAEKPRLLQCLRLCQQMRPCGFVWCTDFDSLDHHGAGSRIWQTEGHIDEKQSILGTLYDAYHTHQQ